VKTLPSAELLVKPIGKSVATVKQFFEKMGVLAVDLASSAKLSKPRCKNLSAETSQPTLLADKR